MCGGSPQGDSGVHSSVRTSHLTQEPMMLPPKNHLVSPFHPAEVRPHPDHESPTLNPLRSFLRCRSLGLSPEILLHVVRWPLVSHALSTKHICASIGILCQLDSHQLLQAGSPLLLTHNPLCSCYFLGPPCPSCLPLLSPQYYSYRPS